MITTVRAAAVLGVIAMACGAPKKKSDADDAANAGATDAPARTVTLEGATAELPEGALGATSTFELVAVAAPTEFAGAGATAASTLVVQVVGATGDGAKLTKLATPYALTLPFTGAAKDLCALALAEDGSMLVWRGEALVVGGADAKIATVWLGTYQMFRCGSGVASFLDVASDGRQIRGAGTAAKALTGGYGFCDLRSDAAGGACVHYFGREFDGGGGAATAAVCEQQGATFTPTGACIAEGALGYCIAQYGTTREQATTYYMAPGLTAAALKQSCESNVAAGNRWFAVGAYTPTAVDKQTPAPPEQACGVAAYGACMGTAGVCRAFLGPAYAADAGEQLCGVGESWLATGCPAAGATACCATDGSDPQHTDFAYYEGTTGTAAAAHCSTQGGEFSE